MSVEFFLAQKYIKAHMRQCISVVLTCSLFIAAFITTLIYLESFLATATDDFDQMFGQQAGVVYNADPGKIEQYRMEIESGGSGIVRTLWKVETDTGGQGIYIGSMDPAAIQLRRLELKEGRYAEQPGEVAVESATQKALFPGAECGDTLEISILKEGLASTETYVLVGIIEDYIVNWQSTDAYKISVEYPPPAILTLDDGSPAAYTHVICADNTLEAVLGGQYVTNPHDHLDPVLVSQKSLINTVITVILLFFAAVMAFGILSNISCIMKDQKQYFILLRCIGMNKRKGTLLFLVQAALLFFTASVVGILFSLVLSMAVMILSSAFGRHLIFTVRFSCFWHALLVAAVTIFVAFIAAAGRFFRQMPLETGKEKALSPKRGTKEVRKLKKLWARAVRRQNRLQNVMAVMLIAACLFVTVFGGLLASLLPQISYGNLGAVDQDYSLYIPAGTQAASDFYITTPRPMGVSQEDVELLRSTEGLEVRTAIVEHMTSHFVLYSPKCAIPYFDQLISEERVLLERDVPQLSDVIARLGGAEGDLLVDPRLIGLDYDSAVNSVNLTEGEIDREAFAAGETVIAPNTFSIGDSFLLVTPLLADESAPQGSADRFDFVVKTVTVSAIYDAAEGSRFYYSAEAIMTADASARYDQIELVNLAPNDAAASKQIEKLLDQIVARSPYTRIQNFIAQRQEYVQEIHSGQVLTVMCVAIFIAVVIIAVAYSVKVKIRAGLHSYMLMRAIGASKQTIADLIISDTVRLITTGSAIGIGLGALIPMLLVSGTYHNAAFMESFVWSGLAAVLVFAALLFLGHITTRKLIQDLLREDIASVLGTVEI